MLETKRQNILEEMASITRMRRGIVNEQYFEVRQKDGTVLRHGPYFLYSRTEKGKSFSRRIAGEEVDRYKRETENCRRFKELSNRRVMVGEGLAQDEGDTQDKNGRSGVGEAQRNSPVCCPGREGLRAKRCSGYGSLGAGDASSGPERRNHGPHGIAAEHCRSPVPCPHCLASMESHGRRSKEIITLLGEVAIDRRWSICIRPDCEGRGFPKDVLLDGEHTSSSPGVRRLMAKSGARDSFARPEEDLLEYAGIRVDAKDVERIAEAIGTDMAHRERSHRADAMAGHLSPPGKPIPVLCVACDGTGVPVTKRETAGHKNIIGARMKKSGARRSVRGANDIITLRCTLASSRFEDYWAERASA